jgi:UDP-N-acetylmuramoyl-L-alanyl-D-glutamate--2,6-diaminopimelate ligase
MKSLQEILYQVRLLEVRGELLLDVPDLHFDSRQVGPGHLFVAVKGTQVDGHQFIGRAIESGAAVVACQTLPEALDPGVTYVRVADSAEALGQLASNFYGNPSRQLTVIGTTGTNGKTTVTTLLYQLFTALGQRSGLISTVVNEVAGVPTAAKLTTPDAKQLHGLFRQMVTARCSHAFMEVSSIAVDQQRVAGTQFAGGIFTNLTHDHLDYHGTFPNYLRAKQKFFDALPATAFALTNVDDRNGRIMTQNSRARLRTYAQHTGADYTARVIENQLEGLHLDVMGQQVWFRLTGGFNAYNLLAACAAAVELGHDPHSVLLAASTLTGAPGRFERLRLREHVTGIVDYAHTPDALRNVLETARELMADGRGRLIVLAGCGGDRDATKRPEMGRIAAELADVAILTSDNPRNEDPEAILDAMERGLSASLRGRIRRITDRREAISTAAQLAEPHDLIVVAGKGHESYQEINGVRLPFSDRDELLSAFSPPSPLHP